MLKKNITKLSKRLQKSPWLYVAGIATVYFLVNLVAVLYHEPWRDEAQAWTIARDLPLTGILGQLQYEGHPSLWYLVLLPFAKLGFPYLTLNLISLAIMTVAVIVFVRFSPFNKLVTTTLVASSLFMYFMPVISRSYCLVVLLSVLLCILHKKRFDKPIWYTLIIGLLIQTHVWVFSFAGALYLVFAYELWRKYSLQEIIKNRVQVIALVIPIVSVLFAIVTLFSSINGSMTNQAIINLPRHEIPAKMMEFLTITAQEPYYITGLSFICMFALVLLTPYYKKNGFILIASMLGPLLIYTFIYNAALPNRALLILVFILAVTWMTINDHPKSYVPFGSYNLPLVLVLSTILTSLSLLTIQNNLSALASDIKAPYSAGKSMGIYIEDNLPNDAIILAAKAEVSVAAIQPFTHNKFYGLRQQQFITYITWHKGWEKYPTQASVSRQITQLKEQHKQLYIIVTNDEEEKLRYLDLELVRDFSIQGHDSGALYRIQGY